VSTFLHATLYMFLHNLLNVLVQIANKVGLQTKRSSSYIATDCQSASYSCSSYIATDGQSVSLFWCRASFGARDQILISLSGNCYLSFSCRAPSLTRGRVCNLQCNHPSSGYTATDSLSANLSW
jgi:hypothetical protein